MEELIEIFEKETKLKFYTTSLDRGEDLYSYDFVNWLIKQLPIHVVVKSLKGKETISFEEWQFVNDYKKLFDYFVKDGKSFTEIELTQIYNDQLINL
jgi:hypothetical protein